MVQPINVFIWGERRVGRSELECDCDVLHHEAVGEVKRKMESDEILFEIADFYKALSDSTRIKIVCALNLRELCVCDISHLLNMTKSAISHQLKYLRDINIVKSRKEGKEVFYSLKDDHVKKVIKVSLKHIKENVCE